MGTYLKVRTIKKVTLGCTADINEILNEHWNQLHPEYQDMFHLTTAKDMINWLINIHTDRRLAYLRYITSIKELRTAFPDDSEGLWEVKLTLGEYICAPLLRAIKTFVEVHSHFLSHNMENDSVKEAINQILEENSWYAEDCPCIKCTRNKVYKEFGVLAASARVIQHTT